MLRSILQFTFGFSGGLCFVIVTYRFHGQITTIDNSTKEKRQIMKIERFSLLLPLPQFRNYHKQMYFTPNVDIPVACGCGLERFSIHIHPHFFSGSWRTSYPRGLFFHMAPVFDEFPWQLTSTEKRKNESMRQIFYRYICVSQSYGEKSHKIKMEGEK